MTYRFAYRRQGAFWSLWRTFSVAGHRYDEAQDKLVLFFTDGGIREIARWKECEVRLGADWVLAQRKALEAQAGASVPLAVGA